MLCDPGPGIADQAMGVKRHGLRSIRGAGREQHQHWIGGRRRARQHAVPWCLDQLFKRQSPRFRFADRDNVAQVGQFVGQRQHRTGRA